MGWLAGATIVTNNMLQHSSPILYGDFLRVLAYSENCIILLLKKFIEGFCSSRARINIVAATTVSRIIRPVDCTMVLHGFLQVL